MSRTKPQSERREELIGATLKSIELYGLSGTTIKTISAIADISVGLINHHFGTKQALIESAVRYLLEQLKQGLLSSIDSLDPDQDPKRQARKRLDKIVETNFTAFQQSSSAASTWLCFWAEAAHSPELSRLQQVNCRRLRSNLAFSFAQLIDDRAKALDAAETTAAMIDGFWLRSTLSPEPEQCFVAAEQYCKSYIEQLIVLHGVEQEK